MQIIHILLNDKIKLNGQNEVIVIRNIKLEWIKFVQLFKIL